MHFNIAVQRLFSAGRNVFWTAAWLIGLILILLHPLRWLSGDALQPVRMISYVTPWLLILSLPLLSIAAWRRRKWLALVLSAATLAISIPLVPLFLPKQPMSPPPDAFPLKIMSYNQHSIPKIDGMVDVIRREQPDILLIQEYSPALVSPSFHGLDDLYPELFLAVDSKHFGQAVLSRYPLEQVSAEFDKGRTQKVLVKTPAGPITVWNAHPIPPYLIPPEQYDAQILALATDISQTQGPLIVAGDFNATDQSEAYRTINRYLKNAYAETGWGFSFTYPAPPYSFMDMHIQTGPLWRIDHVFYSQEFIATSAQTLRTAGGSDHFPVVAELSMIK